MHRANIVGVGVQAVRLGETWIEEESGGLFCTHLADVAQPASERRASAAAAALGAAAAAELGPPGDGEGRRRGSCAVM